MYQALQKRLGLERVIVVQPNAYQTDNRVTLDAIRALGHNAKGVGVVGPSVTAGEIVQLSMGGICAQRIFQLPGGAIGFDKGHVTLDGSVRAVRGYRRGEAQCCGP